MSITRSWPGGRAAAARRTSLRWSAIALMALALGSVDATSPAAALTRGAAAGPGQAVAGRETAGRDTGSVMLILDASGSMLDPDQGGLRKIDGAKRALRSLINEMPAGTPVGLRVFGRHAAAVASRSACRDSDLVMPVGPLRRATMRAALDRFQARGWTPLGYALRKGADDLPTRSHGSIVLISDGVDECYPAYGPSPCSVARSLARSSIDLKVQTIGLTASASARKQLRCIARVTGGRYWDVDDAGSLAKALSDSIPRPVAEPAKVPPPPPAGASIGPSVLVGFLAVAVTGLAATARSLLGRRKRAYW